MLHRSCLAAAYLCLACSPLAAQGAAASASEPTVAPTPAPGWGAWGGIARNSPDNIWGAESGRDIELIALRLTWPLARSRRVALDYILDAVPAARVSMVRDDTDPPWCRDAKPGEPCVTSPVVSDTRPVLGFGIAPVGIQVRHRSGARVQSYANLSGGMLRFAREMPMDGAARVNYTAELGAGVLIGRPGKLGVAVGYKFYHISNGGTAMHNPGIDNHMVVVGVQQILRF
ncbi:MAG: acyloxyacyl hydrolase [Gemmatimonadaceae bacterium]|nr:acyloxyacyl hydrolase [Gemmatimonadaceae bacterium]